MGGVVGGVMDRVDRGGCSCIECRGIVVVHMYYKWGMKITIRNLTKDERDKQGESVY